MERCEVAVLGLGAMGAATVYQLAKSRVNIIGIDRHHPPPTLGSSHGDTRITPLSVGEGAQYLPFVHRSHALWRNDFTQRTIGARSMNNGTVIEGAGTVARSAWKITSQPITVCVTLIGVLI